MKRYIMKGVDAIGRFVKYRVMRSTRHYEWQTGQEVCDD